MHLNKFLSLLIVLFTIISCTKNDVPKPETNNKIKVTEFTPEGTTIKATLYAEYDSFFVGYNPLYITLLDTKTNLKITNADISIIPMMDMTTMKHSCPVEQPAYTTTDKAYTGAAVFTMATMESMGWTIDVTITVDGKTSKTTVPVTVKNTPSSIKLISSVLNQNRVPYYVVLIHPQKPEQKAKMNDLEIGIYKRNTMLDFPAVDGMKVSFEPTMPSMGHSSPNNVNPVFTSKGHYKGKVNFTMTGDWQLNFTLSGDGSTFADQAAINILF